MGCTLALLRYVAIVPGDTPRPAGSSLAGPMVSKPLLSRNHSVETAKDAKKRENRESDLILGDALPYSLFRDPGQNQNFPGRPSRSFAPFAVQLHRSGLRGVARSTQVCSARNAVMPGWVGLKAHPDPNRLG